MQALLKRFPTGLGGQLPPSLVWKLRRAGKQIHVGRWMQNHNFSCAARLDRFEIERPPSAQAPQH